MGDDISLADNPAQVLDELCELLLRQRNVPRLGGSPPANSAGGIPGLHPKSGDFGIIDHHHHTGKELP